ncbi:MAG: hypothetical protein RL490_765 [Pseudomonadota bacterium]|jgi:hypothetical protein
MIRAVLLCKRSLAMAVIAVRSAIVCRTEIGLSLLNIFALGPLARWSLDVTGRARFGLAEFPI